MAFSSRASACRDGEAQDALPLQPLAQLGAAGEVADLAEVAPVDGQGGQAEGAAIPGQGVEEGVRRRVVALPGVAEDARQRREQDEEIERPAGGLRVQVPGPAHLRGQHPVHPVAVEVDQQGVLQDHRRVQHAAERRQVAVDRGQHRGDVRVLRHVGGVDDDPGAEPLQLGDGLAGLGRVGAAAAHQDEVPAPRSAIQRATASPKPPSPPVIR